MTTAASILDPNVAEKVSKDYTYMESRMNGLSGSFVHDLKKAALSHFERLGIPTSKNEEWKYTPVWKHISEEMCFATVPVVDLKDSSFVDKYVNKKNVIVLFNGVIQTDLCRIEAGLNMEVNDLTSALEDDSQLAGGHFNKIAKVEEEPFTALNTTFFEGGLHLKFNKAFQADEPIVLLQAFDGPEDRFIHQRILIEVASNVEAHVQYEYHFPNGGTLPFINSLEEIYLDSNARFKSYAGKILPAEGRLISSKEVQQQRDSFYKHVAFTGRGKFIRSNIHTSYEGPGCDCSLNGLYLPSDGEIMDNHVAVDHKVPNCTSNQVYKGVMRGTGHGVFNGKIFVREQAQQTNAFQSNKNILLSDKAVIDTKPQLEIFADDVKCSHGATVGQLDDEPVFYLMARGIPEEKARGMLTLAFANEVIEFIEDEELRENWTQVLGELLGAES